MKVTVMNNVQKVDYSFFHFIFSLCSFFSSEEKISAEVHQWLEAIV
jgi:hypothetical protein